MLTNVPMDLTIAQTTPAVIILWVVLNVHVTTAFMVTVSTVPATNVVITTHVTLMPIVQKLREVFSVHAVKDIPATDTLAVMLTNVKVPTHVMQMQPVATTSVVTVANVTLVLSETVKLVMTSTNVMVLLVMPTLNASTLSVVSNANVEMASLMRMVTVQCARISMNVTMPMLVMPTLPAKT